MNVNELIKQFENLSLFELWRIQCAISQLLEDPNKIIAIKRALHIGMEISYFIEKENRTVKATVVEIKKTRISVIDKESGKLWGLPFYMLNLEGVNTNISAPINSGLSKINFKVGDNVYWNSHKHNNTEIFGKILKLNPKYARVEGANGQLWNVPYKMLFPILNGTVNKTSGILIENQ